MRREAKPILAGQRFGMLTAVEPAEKIHGRGAWLCRCDCGRERIVRTSDLKGDRIWSCGCSNRHGHTTLKDLTGQRFGRLTAVQVTDRRDRKGSAYWLCRCECGNTVEVPQDSLVSGNTTSCGCRKQELNTQVNGLLHFVDGTCIEWLKYRKSRSDNSSGFRGVSRTKKNRYRVSIGLQGRRYYLGEYKDFERAKEVRLEAEELLHENFLSQWSKWQQLAEGNEQWAKDHPFRFRVEKINGRLTVEVPAWDETDNKKEDPKSEAIAM